MRSELCHAFCDNLTVREVPVGLAVGTTYTWHGGDPIGFYIIGPNASGQFRVEDDSYTLTLIEALGAELSNTARREAFNELLNEYEVHNDEGQLHTDWMPKVSIPTAALRFVAFLLRVQDLCLMAPERALSTFKEDVTNQLKRVLVDRATIEEGSPISPKIPDVVPDLLIRAPHRDPVALFLIQTEAKIIEAALLQNEASYHHNIPCSVMALVEHNKSIGIKRRQFAENRLSALSVYEGDEEAAIQRVAREVLGRSQLLN